MEETEVKKENKKGQGGERQGYKKKIQEGRNSIKNNTHPMPMNISMDTVFVWARRVQKCM